MKYEFDAKFIQTNGCRLELHYQITINIVLRSPNFWSVRSAERKIQTKKFRYLLWHLNIHSITV